MQFSVVILNYNVRYFLEQCLHSVQRALSGIDAEIIVVDNASADDSCAMVAATFPSVRLIKNEENTGFPKGNNRGIAMAGGNYLCILNPDTVVAEDTFVKLIGFAEKQENPGIIGVKLIDGTGNFLRESKRGVPTPWVAFTKVTGLYSISPKRFGRYYAMHLHSDAQGEVAVLSGAFMFMKRAVYERVGGFDEGCFMYSDDIDLSYRIRQLGYRNCYFPDVVTVHYKGESTLKDGRYLSRFRRAMRYFYKKHFKVNRVFDLFLRLGAWLFTMVKFFRARSSERKKTLPDHYILISDDLMLRSALEKRLGKKVMIIPQETFSAGEAPATAAEFIFDGNCMSNAQIIGLMQRLKHKKHRFKIRPEGCNFMLGSDHSEARGEVVVF
ncbi:MAG: glycosyltransferase family 2 protein [Sinomicrobium sp.]|nr:glycosyltransferase family 2 protein [Sinomicrobium sp.]